jgi:hypothetical protein
MTAVQKDFWCDRVRLCFDTFVRRPTALQHMLLFGPPGSGKTTSAAWLVQQIWGNQAPLMSMTLNAADERSLEAIRQKIFPFVRSTWAGLPSAGDTEGRPRGPRFLILDECETLTEAAQLSLQAILDRDPQDVCVLLICNSQSRIHPKLRQRLLKIRYDPPRGKAALRSAVLSGTSAREQGTAGRFSESASSAESAVPSSAFTEITRGDLRFNDRKEEMEERLWFYLHSHPATLVADLQATGADTHAVLTELLLLATLLQCADEPFLQKLNTIVPFLSTGLQTERVFGVMAELVALFREKFELSLGRQ